jgi:hypothetical protein
MKKATAIIAIVLLAGCGLFKMSKVRTQRELQCKQ